MQGKSDFMALFLNTLRTRPAEDFGEKRLSDQKLRVVKFRERRPVAYLVS